MAAAFPQKPRVLRFTPAENAKPAMTTVIASAQPTDAADIEAMALAAIEALTAARDAEGRS